MSNHEFQHFRKAPHPFEIFGDLPPIALNNRSIKKDYSSIPQGQDSFDVKIGKKQYEEKYKSSIKNNLFFEDSLSKQLNRHGKSLQTRDIQGAQGGSLKSSAVKYKQKAQKIKMQSNQITFDRNQYEKDKYRRQIQHFIQFQHQNDRQVGKFISQKGNGYIMNPQRAQSNSSQLKSSQNSQISSNEPYIKWKNVDNQGKNKGYNDFFNQLKNNEENYENFFDNASKQFQKEKKNDNYSKVSFDSKNRSPQIKKFQTIEHQIQNQNNLQESRNKQSSYSPKYYAKKSIQSQFKLEQGLGIDLIDKHLAQRQNKSHQPRTDINNNSLNKNLQNYIKAAQMHRKIRKFNPTNLSTVIDSSHFSRQLYS